MLRVVICVGIQILIQFTNQIPSQSITYTNMKQLNQTSQNLRPEPVNKYKFDPIEELGLKMNKENKEDFQQIVNLLTVYLTYPSHQLGELHMESNRLGKEDLKSEIESRLKTDQASAKERQNIEFCPCCSFVRQTQQIKICTHLAEINNIGISTYLYFQTIKNLVILLIIMSLGYSIYALATNVKASAEYQALIAKNQNFSSIPLSQLSTLSYVSLSLGSKQINDTTENKAYYFIQCWIGLGVVIVWLFMFFCLKNSEQKQEAQVQEETISASDFTIVIQNMPKDITKQELQKKFNDYFETITNVPQVLKKPLQIEKINIGEPFYLNQQDFKDEQLQELRDRHEKMLEKFVDWVKQRQDSASFSTTKEERQKAYDEFKDILEKQQKKYKEIGQKIQKQILSKQNQKETTTIFVTFKTSHAMRLIANLNDPALSSRLRYYLTCCRGHNKFAFSRGQQDFNIKIERAAEPEDILWTNLAVPTGEYIKRKIITYSVTFILLGISFAIVYGLSKAQQSNSQNQILSLVISITISVINVILAQVIRRLSIYEMEYTFTKYQTSLALKSIFAALINSILIPVIVNYYIKEDVYGQNGLASDVFMLGLTNSFVAPILKLIDISYIINRLLKYIASKPNSRLTANQLSLNRSYEYLQFEVGQQYVYLVSLYLFTCFFVSLQPIIAFFAFCGMGLMYWTQKYSLLNKMRRPAPGTDLVNVAMFQLILFGSFIYSLGSLTWSNFMPNGIPKQALLPNLIALGISLVIFVMPYRAIIAACKDQNPTQNLIYEQKRMILSSEYDRLNPATSAQALKDFQEFYMKKISQLDKAGNEEQKKKFMNDMMRQQARGQQQRPPQQPFGNLFNPASALLPPPPQMMFGGPTNFMMGPQYRPQFQQPMGFQQPGFQPMGFQQPGFQQPGFQPVRPPPPQNFQPPPQQNFQPPPQQIQIQPSVYHQPPGIQQPGFQQPGFQQPGFQQPGFQQQRPPPGFQQPGFQQPGFQQPGFQQPGFQLPGFQMPNFGLNMQMPQANFRFGF